MILLTEAIHIKAASLPTPTDNALELISEFGWRKSPVIFNDPQAVRLRGSAYEIDVPEPRVPTRLCA